MTRYQILEHPEEHGQAIDAVTHHQEVFARPPRLVAADRGVHSAETEEKLKTAGGDPGSRKGIGGAQGFGTRIHLSAGISVASGDRGTNCQPVDYGWRKSRYHGRDGME